MEDGHANHDMDTSQPSVNGQEDLPADPAPNLAFLDMDLDPPLPEPEQVPAKKYMTSLFEAVATVPPGCPEKTMSLPKKISKHKKHLLTLPTRKSPRLHNQEGFRHISLDNLPRKRPRSTLNLVTPTTGTDPASFLEANSSQESDPGLNLDAPPAPTGAVPPPIPIKTLFRVGGFSAVYLLARYLKTGFLHQRFIMMNKLHA